VTGELRVSVRIFSGGTADDRPFGEFVKPSAWVEKPLELIIDD